MSRLVKCAGDCPLACKTHTSIVAPINSLATPSILALCYVLSASLSYTMSQAGTGGQTPDPLRCGAPSRPCPPGRTQRSRGADGHANRCLRRRTRSKCRAVYHGDTAERPGAYRRTFRTSTAAGRGDNAERPGAFRRTAHTSSAVCCAGSVAGPSRAASAAFRGSNALEILCARRRSETVYKRRIDTPPGVHETLSL